MREIKFRQWNENDVFSSNKMDYNPVLEYSTGMATMAVDINWLMKKHQSNLMRFTGLKDKNGTEIYEGDISWDEWNDCYGVVRFDEGKFVYEWENVCEDLIEVHDFLDITGNIYEHKYLLEESK